MGDVQYEEIQIPTITLTDLLDQNDVERIDLLTMDIEDAEPLALAGFDIDRFKPELACVEAHVGVRESLMEYFSAHGYRRLEQYSERDPFNYYFARSPPGG